METNVNNARGKAMTATLQEISRDEAIQIIRKALKVRSGKAWSVKGGRGTSWGWIDISSPPARCNEFGSMSEADRLELAQLLGLDVVHHQGVQVAASLKHRNEYVARAEGRTPEVLGEQYWD